MSGPWPKLGSQSQSRRRPRLRLSPGDRSRAPGPAGDSDLKTMTQNQQSLTRLTRAGPAPAAAGRRRRRSVRQEARPGGAAGPPGTPRPSRRHGRHVLNLNLMISESVNPLSPETDSDAAGPSSLCGHRDRDRARPGPPARRRPRRCYLGNVSAGHVYRSPSGIWKM